MFDGVILHSFVLPLLLISIHSTWLQLSCMHRRFTVTFKRCYFSCYHMSFGISFCCQPQCLRHCLRLHSVHLGIICQNCWTPKCHTFEIKITSTSLNLKCTIGHHSIYEAISLSSGTSVESSRGTYSSWRKAGVGAWVLSGLGYCLPRPTVFPTTGKWSLNRDHKGEIVARPIASCLILHMMLILSNILVGCNFKTT